MPSENMPYLFAVYSVTWAFFFAYAFFVSRRQKELEREITELQTNLRSVEGEPSSNDG